MLSYWLGWSLLTLLKGVLLAGSVFGALGGILHFSEYALLAVIFVPASIFFLYDFVWQILVLLIGGEGYRNHKPSDTPTYMGLAPPYKEARKLLKEGKCIIWS